MNRAIAGVDDSPAALGTHFAHAGARMRHPVARAAGIRGLVETIWRRDRADLYRFKKNVVARVSAHAAGVMREWIQFDDSSTELIADRRLL